MNKRGVLFFTTDTIIAAAVLTATFIILTSFYINTPFTSDITFQNEQFMIFITETEMGNLPFGTYTGTLDSETRNIKVIDWISILYHRGDEDEARILVENIKDLILTDAYNLNYLLDNNSIYQDTLHDDLVISVSSYRISYFVYNDTLYGPNGTKVILWY